MNRRQFNASTSKVMAGSAIASILPLSSIKASSKITAVMVGTGIRGITCWGKTVVENYSDLIEFVGLCDTNAGRVAFAKSFMGVNCPVFTSFEEMMKKVKPSLVIVTTVDSTHHEYIIRSLELGIDVLTEKPMTTHEDNCKAILEAEKKSGKKVTIGFNYRYGTLFTGIKEQLFKRSAGDLVSVDFNWYLNVYHGADYFRRWHALKEKSGTLLVHKSTHHFDLLNWWLDSDPIEVMAYGSLDFYGKNNPYRYTHCRPCPYKEKCEYYWDITKDNLLMNLYAKNENLDGYLRDACVWRPEINIYDKMSVQIKYANNVLVNYSLTTYSPYEGWRIAFNGKSGRIESAEGIPPENQVMADQSNLHKKEMEQNKNVTPEKLYDKITVMKNFGSNETIQVPKTKEGHGGGDKKLQDKIFRNPTGPDPYRHSAGTRDGAMSILIGIAARRSIEEGKPIKISELTDIVPMAKRP